MADGPEEGLPEWVDTSLIDGPDPLEYADLSEDDWEAVQALDDKYAADSQAEWEETKEELRNFEY